MPTLQEVRAIHDLPLPELLFRAQASIASTTRADEVQLCTLLSVKTGGCPEDCGYCPQSAHYETPVDGREVARRRRSARRGAARRAARARRASAWARRGARSRTARRSTTCSTMVRGVRALGMEACVTLGMLTDDQARRLKEAGLTAYNHNLDTSRGTTSRSSRRAPTTIACRR